VTTPEPDHWFEPAADRMGRAYLRYAHTKGTVQEVDHLVNVLALVPGMRVLDVGCGPGRHAHELARRGIACHGIDISARFVELAEEAAPDGATFERADARVLAYDAEFDAVIALCQGAFGLSRDPGDDDAILAAMARALRPGGRLAVSAFNAYFAVRYQTAAAFDAGTGVAHEITEIHDENGVPASIDLWTGCYTPRELRLLAASAGLVVERLSSVEPGAYGDDPPTIERPELLLVARRPAGAQASGA
jgi:ubiquinone/menaquinone biosynthesis C-methylase UbiE